MVYEEAASAADAFRDLPWIATVVGEDAPWRSEPVVPLEFTPEL